MTNPSIQAGYIKRVEWAIQVCRTDLNNFRDGDWLNLKEELYEFLTEEIEWSFGLRPQNLSNEDVVKLGYLIGESSSTSIKNSITFRRIKSLKDKEFAKQMMVYADQLMALANRDRKLWNRTLKIEDAQIINEVLSSAI